MLTRLLQAAIRVYQLLVSPLLGDCCRFEPSCSRYAQLCLRHHGLARASWLVSWRLLRCNPLAKGGIDLPPLPPGVDPAVAEPNWARVDRLLNHRLPGVHVAPALTPKRPHPVRSTQSS